MDTTAPPRIRLLASIGGVAALALAGGMFFMSRAGTDAAAAEPLPPPAVITANAAAATPKKAAAPKQAVAKKTAAPVKTAPKPHELAKPAAPKQVAVKKTAAPVKAAPKPHELAKPQAQPTPRVIAANGLPMAVATELAQHGVVVVALYAGGAAVDQMARDEAQAGASDAGVGFAAVDVADERALDALTRKVEIVDAPAVLVFGRDGNAEARFDGFADRLIVAQLASSVR
jgi:type IV secretory pathway VirB10-like protein